MIQNITRLQQRIDELCKALKDPRMSEYQKDYLFRELEYACLEFARLRKEEMG